MAHRLFNNETREPYGPLKVSFSYSAFAPGPPPRLGDRGWYLHACFPGCLPEGDLSGPFETEEEAIKDADNL